jgi:hypothetical protein
MRFEFVGSYFQSSLIPAVLRNVGAPLKRFTIAISIEIKGIQGSSFVLSKASLQVNALWYSL